MVGAATEQVDEGSGAWGAFAKLVQGGADLLGDASAVSALEEGEDHGIKTYADAMKEVSQPNSPAQNQTPQVDIRNAAPSPEQQQKSKKHATMDWSFSMAMQEADEEAPNDIPEQITPGRHTRPAPLLRTMTQPVTSHEVNETVRRVLIYFSLQFLVSNSHLQKGKG